MKKSIISVLFLAVACSAATPFDIIAVTKHYQELVQHVKNADAITQAHRAALQTYIQARVEDCKKDSGKSLGFDGDGFLVCVVPPTPPPPPNPNAKPKDNQ